MATWEAGKIDLKFVSDPRILFGDLICDLPYRVGGLYDLYECGAVVYGKIYGYLILEFTGWGCGDGYIGVLRHVG